MEILILIAIVGIAYFYMTNNSTKVKDETVIRTTQTVKTASGEQTITRTTTVNDVRTDIHPPSTPINMPEHRIIQPVVQQPKQEKPNYEQPKLNNQYTPHIEHKPQPQLQVKECSGCKRIQPLSQFRPNSNHPDGLTKWCIQCLDTPAPKTPKGMKFCPKCKQNRRKTSFYSTSKYPDGLSKWCKFCLQQRAR